MTRYILAGGGDLRSPTYISDLSKVLASEQRPLNILNCMFARPREEWEEAFGQWQPYMAYYFGADTRPVLADPYKFEEQLASADVVYLHGGDDVLLAHYLERYKHLAKRFRGKTIIGSSAGATFLCTYGWTCDWRKVWKGSGIVKARVIVHYESNFGANNPRGPIDWEAAKQALEPYDHKLPMHCLHEGEFTIIEQK
jgi:hypothetical protein